MSRGQNGWLIAGIIYAIAVFAVGFALGTVRVLLLAPRVGPRAAMGLIAFALLMLLELATSLFVFGNPWSGYLDSFKSTAASIGLVAQIGFAAIPVIQGQRAAGRNRG